MVFLLRAVVDLIVLTSTMKMMKYVVVNSIDAENDVVVRQHCTVMNSQHSRRDVRGRDEA